MSRSALVSTFAAILLVLFAGCSSTDDNATTNYVSVDAAPAPVEVGVEAVPLVAGLDAVPLEVRPTDDFEAVTAAFDDFLVLRAQAITGDLPLTELESVATSAAIEQVIQLRDDNDDRIASDSYAALSGLAEWSNVTSISQLDGRMIFTDCTEQQYLTPGGATVVNFVTNDVQVIDDNGRFKVDAVAVSQDGVASADPEHFGCVPPSFAERAALTARTAVEEAAQLIADPGVALEQGLPPIFADLARTELDRSMRALVAQDLSRTADEIVQYDVLGMDVNRADFTVVVAVCRIFANGRSYTEANGQLTASDLSAGTSLEEWVYVNLEAVASGQETADTVVAVLERGPNCQRG